MGTGLVLDTERGSVGRFTDPRTKGATVTTKAAQVSRPRGRPKKLENLTVDQLVEQGQQLLAAIAEVEAGPAEGYKALANLIVQLRARFNSPSNPKLPDWKGSSAEYREAAARMYAEVEIPPDSQDAMQSRIRYHISNQLREIAPPRQLKALGMSDRGQMVKARESRASKKGLPAGVRVTTRADLFREARAVIEGVVFDLPSPDSASEEYISTMKELSELTKLCTQLLAMHERRRSDERNRMELLTTFQKTRLQLPEIGEDLNRLRSIREQTAQEAREFPYPGLLNASAESAA